MRLQNLADIRFSSHGCALAGKYLKRLEKMHMDADRMLEQAFVAIYSLPARLSWSSLLQAHRRAIWSQVQQMIILSTKAFELILPSVCIWSS